MPRQSGGTYILPALNPVITGTIITSDWANGTLDDVAGALTDSLSRSGAGNMLVPFRVPDGTNFTPGYSFLNEVQSGIYRAAAGDIRVVIEGVDVARWFGGKIQQWSGSEWLDVYQTADLVPFTPEGTVTSDNVQDAITEVSDNLTNTSASAIAVVPAGTITSDNVQDALEELDTLKGVVDTVSAAPGVLVTGTATDVIVGTNYSIVTTTPDINDGINGQVFYVVSP